MLIAVNCSQSDPELKKIEIKPIYRFKFLVQASPPQRALNEHTGQILF